ncbi:MAG: SDR family oxidoreductase [Bacillota bacterium]|jgi:NAD(P)-dependent dehydrogenase (short-subunit alcohol dehydrogenase family)|nr:SDR family oxidoreductase [Bacillota bacterium]
MIKGKVAVITGGGGVLCSAFAKELASKGAKVAVLDLRIEAAKAVSDSIRKEGGVSFYYKADVLDKANIEAVREKINKDLGMCDILINGAGGNSPKATTTYETFDTAHLHDKDITTFFDLDPKNINNLFQLNFTGTFIPTQVFAKDMATRGGTILNISSMSAYSPMTKVMAYSAAKAAISNFTMWLAVHFAPSNIRVNAMAPGFFDTNQNHALLFNSDNTPTQRTKKILSQTPLNRLGEVKDLLGTLIYLCDDEMSGFVTGAVIPVDGGFLAYSGV